MILLGHSLGGFIAGAYAAKYPQRLAGADFCLIHRAHICFFQIVCKWFADMFATENMRNSVLSSQM
jgi:pimeloyl-ACP methyl ester carboxylesterase